MLKVSFPISELISIVVFGVESPSKGSLVQRHQLFDELGIAGRLFSRRTGFRAASLDRATMCAIVELTGLLPTQSAEDG